jgi:AcrR family transcriptional regulator
MTAARAAAPAARPRRADARRNRQAVREAAAALFATAGVEVPMRDVAAAAGVGTATLYRNFPTRATLVAAVCRERVAALADAAPALLADGAAPHVALAQWVDGLVDLLLGYDRLAALLQADDPDLDPLRACVVDGLAPAAGALLDAAADAGEIRPGVDARDLIRAVAGICAGADGGRDVRPLVGFLVAGMRRTD